MALLLRPSAALLVCLLVLCLLTPAHAEDKLGPDAALTTAGVMGVVGAVVGCCFLTAIVIVLGCNHANKRNNMHHVPLPPHTPVAAPVVMAQPSYIVSPVNAAAMPTPAAYSGYSIAAPMQTTYLADPAPLGMSHGSQHIMVPQSPTTFGSVDPHSPTPLLKPSTTSYVVGQQYAPVYAAAPAVRFG